MYLAPLNYDRYFRKVFSDTGIAKRFLEDFFDTRIESIELLTTCHKLTDDSAAVEFDFRCRIGDQFVIIDMQQWYKPDIVHRFYTYHCISTALQLESMPLKSIYLETDKERKIKDYNELLPVVTLIDTPGGFSGGESGEAAPPDDLADLARASADQQAARAHVRLWCVDSTRPLTPWEREQLRRDDPDRWIVLTKCDAACATDYRGPAVATSSLTGEGLDALRRAVERRLVACERSGDAVPQTARRCRPALSAAGEALRRAAALCDARAGDELVAAELRAALSALGEVVGAVATDELLDRIFSRFCIGK